MGGKLVMDAYILALPFGWLGLHHYYLGRKNFGLIYTFTCGLIGFGWIFDWFRIRSLVRECNEQLYARNSKPTKRLDDAYILACNPIGFLGLYHYYLERKEWGIFYTVTLGVFGIGWILDIIRMPCLVQSVNEGN